jgi:hypothetical protein
VLLQFVYLLDGIQSENKLVLAISRITQTISNIDQIECNIPYVGSFAIASSTGGPHRVIFCFTVALFGELSVYNE